MNFGYAITATFIILSFFFVDRCNDRNTKLQKCQYEIAACESLDGNEIVANCLKDACKEDVSVKLE